MLSWEDCVALSGLTQDEIAAIAEHEHIPQMLAAELGSYLIQQEDGTLRVKAILADDLRRAEEKGNLAHAEELRSVLRHFIARCESVAAESAATRPPNYDARCES